MMFMPQKLETVEVDTEKKIFKINGKDFGEECTGFNIYCKTDGFMVRVEIDTTVILSNYDKTGILKESRNFQTNNPWFSEAADGLGK